MPPHLRTDAIAKRFGVTVEDVVLRLKELGPIKMMRCVGDDS